MSFPIPPTPPPAPFGILTTQSRGEDGFQLVSDDSRERVGHTSEVGKGAAVRVRWTLGSGLVGPNPGLRKVRPTQLAFSLPLRSGTVSH